MLSEPSDVDPTALSASERDLLVAVGGLLEDGSPPSMDEVWARLEEESGRYSTRSLFYKRLTKLDEEGFIDRRKSVQDGRSKEVGLTELGEETLNQLAERSANSARDIRIA